MLPDRTESHNTSHTGGVQKKSKTFDKRSFIIPSLTSRRVQRMIVPETGIATTQVTGPFIQKTRFSMRVPKCQMCIIRNMRSDSLKAHHTEFMYGRDLMKIVVSSLGQNSQHPAPFTRLFNAAEAHMKHLFIWCV